MTKSMAPIADLFSMESLLPTRLLGNRLLAVPREICQGQRIERGFFAVQRKDGHYRFA